MSLTMARLPRIADIDGSSVGNGFFLCARKDRRSGRTGPFLVLNLQDASGEMDAKVFQDADAADQQFEAGEFVAVQGRGNVFNGKTELVLERIRRVIPDDARHGFREEDCIRCSPRPVEAMWSELMARLEAIEQPALKVLLHRLVERYGERLRVWPAARQIHHAYRSGLLEHVLKIMEGVAFMADAYGLRKDLLIAGAFLHDLGKLEELNYEIATDYSLEGNLLGHIAIGSRMLRDEIRGMTDFPADLAVELEHLVLSHHGQREMGSPVVPMTLEALVLSAIDDLDAKLNQVRRHMAEDGTSGPFTGYNRYLERVFLKPSAS